MCWNSRKCAENGVSEIYIQQMMCWNKNYESVKTADECAETAENCWQLFEIYWNSRKCAETADKCADMNKNVEQQKNAETADNVLAIVWYVFKQLKNMLK